MCKKLKHSNAVILTSQAFITFSIGSSLDISASHICCLVLGSVHYSSLVTQTCILHTVLVGDTLLSPQIVSRCVKLTTHLIIVIVIIKPPIVNISKDGNYLNLDKRDVKIVIVEYLHNQKLINLKTVRT